MNELTHGQVIPDTGKLYRFKIELNGGSAIFYEELSDGTPEALKTFDGTEEPLKRRFKHEVVEGEKCYFHFTGGAKAFYR